ncbi:MAG: SUMF1/EgtB/PvdO family nonheme iron enzyme [Chlorobiaceae bacterium]|nr:SUMF1/EgtB/PvdO family nonheme iron enzyme [Chlorobiaceae bacterium]
MPGRLTPAIFCTRLVYCRKVGVKIINKSSSSAMRSQSITLKARIFWLVLLLIAAIPDIVIAKVEAAKSPEPSVNAVSRVVNNGKSNTQDSLTVNSAGQKAQGDRNPHFFWGSLSLREIVELIAVAVTLFIAVIGWVLYFHTRKKIPEDAEQIRRAQLNAENQNKKASKDEENKTDYDCYQATLKAEMGYIRMLGIPGVKNIQVNLNKDTFVPLRLCERQGGEDLFRNQDFSRTETIMYPDQVMKRAFKKHRMLLVIGDPGAGKTTLLKYYILCCLSKDYYKTLGFSGTVNVFYLPLRELILQENGHYDSLPASLSLWSANHHQTIKEAVFNEWLQSGTSLVLLDGLDEVSNTQERIEVCKWIDNAWSGFNRSYFVVTSRATGYRKDEGVELAADNVRADVQDFIPEQQERFLANWFTAAFLKDPCDEGVSEVEFQRLQKERAAQRTETIIHHLNEEKNKGLRQLAAVPMILQIMAILWKDQDYMPESRVKLYDAALDYLLELRDKRRKIRNNRGYISAALSRTVLAPVSFWMQEELKTDEVDRAEMHVAMQKLLDNLDNPPSAEEFCDYLVKRAGLLMEYGTTSYVFRHKSFREYLASVELIKKVLRTTGYLDTLISGFGEDWWEEPIKFFIAQSDAETFNLFMEKFFDLPKSELLTPKQLFLLLILIEEAPLKKNDALSKKLLDPATTVERQRLILDCLKAVGKSSALEAIEQFKSLGLAKNKDVADKAEEVMFLLLSGVENIPVELDASRVPTAPTIITLKNRQVSFRNPNEHNAEYILIQGGSYRCSVTKKREKVADTYVAKYPITNRRYRSFIASLKSADQANTDNIFSIKLSELAGTIPGFRTYLDEEPLLSKRFLSFYDEDRKFGGDDQPVVGVSWYAARAYCLWLSLLEGNPKLYTLPTDKEWEFAAAGKEGRKYPWSKEKGEPTSKLANYGENVGATTPVGSYPEGATPEGVYDMAGNVWEWMDNLYDEKKEYRSLRGGSWSSKPENLRCSVRSYYYPVNWFNDLGFRVVRSSPLSSS